MPRCFPAQPNLEHFRKQAKQLLRDVRNGDAAAVRRATAAHPRASGTQVPGLSLHDAQLVVAREFGFASWRRLVDAVERHEPQARDQRHVVITGGAGFIGSHLAERCLALGHRVTAFDDLSTGSRDNVVHLLDDDAFELVVGDICDAAALDAAVADADILYHLAANMGRARGIDFDDCLHNNVRGTEVVLDAASRHDVRFVLASTSGVYGNLEPGAVLREEEGPFLGNDRVLGWDYFLSKIVSEELTRDHVRRHGLRSTTARLFNTNGPRGRETVLPVFLERAQRHEALTLFGDGTQSRCFTDVRDTVEGLVRLGASKDAVGETVNIAARQEVTVHRLAECIKEVTGSPSTIEKVPHEFDIVPSRVPCVDKARQLLGWTAVHPVDDSIREILAVDGGSAPV